MRYGPPQKLLPHFLLNRFLGCLCVTKCLRLLLGGVVGWGMGTWYLVSPKDGESYMIERRKITNVERQCAELRAFLGIPFALDLTLAELQALFRGEDVQKRYEFDANSVVGVYGGGF
jgi:hypothetical protein